MRTMIVLPTYQEAANIVEALERIRAAAPEADVLVVDDSSPDGTADLASATAQERGQIALLVRPRKEGLGAAYRHGFQEALDRGYEVIVQMDADLSHDPATLPTLLAEVERGAEMVIGSRYVPGGSIPHWPWYRRALSRYGNRYACIVLRMTVHDATSGFRAYRAKALRQIKFETTRAKGYGFQIETAYRMSNLSRVGLVEVPIVFTDRVRGQSKMSLAVMAEELLLVTWWGVRDLVRGRRV
jgi:glycosyltransferase involved in cell wall biosynthesis